MERTPKFARGAGLTMIELALSSVLLVLVSGALTTALFHVRSVASEGGVDAKLREQAERALASIIADLNRSGDAVVGGGNCPYLFDDGNATGAFAQHAHPPAKHQAAPGDSDFGVDREIVLAEPSMTTLAPGDEVPTLDSNGALTWSSNVVSWVLITGADGINYLQRRVNAGNPRRVANHVERVAFDTNASAPTAGIPNGAVRVQLFFRERDADGVLHKHGAEVTVRLRN